MAGSEQNDPRESMAHQSHLDHSLKLAKSTSDALIDAHLRLYGQIEAINRKWFERLRETKDSEIELGNSLLQCPNPIEASALCREWVMRRGEVLACDMQNFSKAWLDFCADTAALGSVGLPHGMPRSG